MISVLPIVSFVLALVSGVLICAVVCRAIHLKLWLDLALGAMALGLSTISMKLTVNDAWPLAGFVVGYFILWASFKTAQVQSRPKEIPLSELHKVWGRGK